jgi:hypothetical protein
MPNSYSSRRPLNLLRARDSSQPAMPRPISETALNFAQLPTR